jgi:TRAP-type C4-dicarboxylate transport system permease small subunit
MLAIVFIQVVLRYIFSAPLSWAEEMTRYLLVWTSCLGAAYATKKGLHVSLQFIFNRFPDFLKRSIGFLLQILVILFSTGCFVTGLDISFSQWNQISPGLRLRMTWPYLSIPCGFSMIILFCIEDLLFTISKKERNKPSAP